MDGAAGEVKRMKTPKIVMWILNEKPPRFWYTVIACYSFLLPILFSFTFIVMNDILKTVTICPEIIQMVADGLDYAGYLSIALFVYLGFGWLVDRGFPTIRTTFGWLVNIPGRIRT
ncbi:MAG: hypothetical protein MUP03_09615 [Anaerolineales bacterium]|nr:hypothetical protein [Anaerolineales bacterium]